MAPVQWCCLIYGYEMKRLANYAIKCTWKCRRINGNILLSFFHVCVHVHSTREQIPSPCATTTDTCSSHFLPLHIALYIVLLVSIIGSMNCQRHTRSWSFRSHVEREMKRGKMFPRIAMFTAGVSTAEESIIFLLTKRQEVKSS